MKYLNLLISVLILCFYSYQFVFVCIRLLKKMPEFRTQKMHKYAVVVPARNESKVIGDLLKSIHSQDYPKELLDIFVIADNCTDNTAEVARRYGAIVFERYDEEKIGKGYALEFAFKKIKEYYGIDHYEGYLVFDADNILDANFVKEINKVFDAGYSVVTSYRNSKNYGYNWISAGYALWFLRESKYLNGARMICRTSCTISGTGFLVSSEIIKKDGGWKYHLMTEDIEFTVDKVLHGEVIGYCEKAILYDEQPIDLKTSWNQRIRWTKGFYQIVQNYGMKLLRGCWSDKGFQCFDMLATVFPAILFLLVLLTINILAVIYGLINFHYEVVVTALSETCSIIYKVYLSLLFFGLITLITEWKQIHCDRHKKILYLFPFPFFIFTYVPIAIAALAKKVTWVQIPHTFTEQVTR